MKNYPACRGGGGGGRGIATLTTSYSCTVQNANNKGADQTAHGGSQKLIHAISARFIKPCFYTTRLTYGWDGSAVAQW